MLFEAYVALGSNVGDRQANISNAIEALRALSHELSASALYETLPRGFTPQPLFLNAVCHMWVPLDPFQLLARIGELERSAGRHRAFLNGPRVLDIDILTWGRMMLKAPHLTLPHPKMAERDFVLVPLAEIAPAFVHPVHRRTAQSLLADLPTPWGVRRWSYRAAAAAEAGTR